VKDWANAVCLGVVPSEQVPDVLLRAVCRLNTLSETDNDKVARLTRKEDAMWLLSEAVGKPRRGNIEFRLTWVDGTGGFRFCVTKWEAIDTTVPAK
jgi:hypothetical protein